MMKSVVTKNEKPEIPPYKVQSPIPKILNFSVLFIYIIHGGPRCQ